MQARKECDVKTHIFACFFPVIFFFIRQRPHGLRAPEVMTYTFKISIFPLLTETKRSEKQAIRLMDR